MSEPPMQIIDVAVPLSARDYAVHVGVGALEGLARCVARSDPRPTKVAVVSDDNVARLYAASVRASLEHAGFDVWLQVVPAGEASKSLALLQTVVESFVVAGLGRGDAVVALGGGVIGDLAGLAAATFMRGVRVWQCPTSLLAQVDASVGGKVAIDLPVGKNLLGTFHFPTAVLVDPRVLSTLPEREFACGLAEMLKHGLLFAPDHVTRLLADADAMHDRDAPTLAAAVAASVRLKAACVATDPLERLGASGHRVLLNLGHTLGHAIEAASDFAVPHGEAVGLGLCAAARLSERAGIAEAGLERWVESALERLRLPRDLDGWLTGARGESVFEHLRHDKKRTGGRVTYIGLERIGSPRLLQLRAEEIWALLRPLGSPC